MLLKKWIFVPVVLVVLLSGCLTVKPDSPETYKMTLKGLQFHIGLQTALDEAKAREKPVFAYFRSESCGWCKKFENETFTNETVIKTLNENFILVSLDVYEQENETRNFRIGGTPTEIFLDSNGTEITRIRGYSETGPFLDTVNEIVRQEVRPKEAKK